MIVINGAQGEGGGQVFRTSLTLAMCLNKAVKIEDIRAGRKKPGLLRQHLTCLQAAAEICGATITGDTLGSSVVTFAPNKVKAGKYRFCIGSAGSTTLVFQTILMPLLLAKTSSEVIFEGGTHNGMSPSYDFIQQSFLPALLKMGGVVNSTLKKHGFYPAGGGAWIAQIHPVTELLPFELPSPGKVETIHASVLISGVSNQVAQRELEQVQQHLNTEDLILSTQQVASACSGNVLSLKLEAACITQTFDAIGERGVRAQKVADRAVAQLQRYLKADVGVGEYLADQLLLPMVLGKGGVFSTLKPSQHLLTNISIIEQMTTARITLVEKAEDNWQLTVNC